MGNCSDVLRRGSGIVLLVLLSLRAMAGASEVNWPRATPADVGLDAQKLQEARDYALTGNGSGYIIRRGKLVMAWGDLHRLHDLNPIVAAIQTTSPSLSASDNENANSDAQQAPYPPSPVLSDIQWAPADAIVRHAKGSDNWPMTWAADDLLYTAYGDGFGFEPYVPRKLSMGLARVEGHPPDCVGVNVRSDDFERLGDGQQGPKVCSLLAVDHSLYALVRNTGNSQLAWSQDHGRSWTWSAWKFDVSFGYPAFLNFGKNYDGARDGFVYLYSHDSDSAYQRADRMVLARVPVERITEREAYEFFVALDKEGRPQWSSEVARRGAVFQHVGNCYRSSVSYCAPLKGYLWCQTGAGKDPRQAGGLAIYDAPEPWGPWTTVFFASQWDVGPGETSCLPTKWMSADGRTIHLVFSGDDCFSVRRGQVQVRSE